MTVVSSQLPTFGAKDGSLLLDDDVDQPGRNAYSKLVYKGCVYIHTHIYIYIQRERDSAFRGQTKAHGFDLKAWPVGDTFSGRWSWGTHQTAVKDSTSGPTVARDVA